MKIKIGIVSIIMMVLLECIYMFNGGSIYTKSIDKNTKSKIVISKR